MKPRPVRLGMAGCGRAASSLHLPALTRLPEFEVVAVADPDPDRSAAAADRFSIPSCYAGYEALLEDPDVEAVAVCVPPELHAEVAVEVMASGKHLFLEKPLASSLEEGDRVLEAARASGATAMLGLNLRWHPLVRRAHESIRAGSLGPIRLIHTTFTSAIAARGPLPAWRRDRGRGGGVLFEVATHHFDLWHHLSGAEVEEVFAWSRSIDGHDDVATATARLSDGSLAVGSFSQRTAGRNEIEIQGDRARLSFSCYAFDGPHVVSTALPAGSPVERIRRAIRTLRDLPVAVGAARRGGVFRSSYAHEWRHFAECVRRGREPSPGLADGYRALRVTLAGVESAKSGHPVRLDEPAAGSEAHG